MRSVISRSRLVEVFLLLYVLSLAVTSAIRINNEDETVVRAPIGPMKGVVYDTYRAFRGVPFIRPPIDKLRFQPPVPIDSWIDIVDATRYKPGCPQACILPPGTCPEELSEDCIYLNIFTPRLSKIQRLEKLPVLVWLPGGHFEQGSAGVDLYDGGFFVNRTDSIVVTVGYRLGALGWLTDMSIGLTGNYGLMDQLEGLKWVKRNIAAFGGDPDRVTLAGQSAGATSTAALLISAQASQLFHRAILQSNPMILPFRRANDASVLGAKFNKQIGCKSIECLQSKSTDELVKVQHDAAAKFNLSEPLVAFLPWVPTIDGDLVPMGFMEAMERGKYNKMPLMIGSVSEEAHLFIFMASNNKTTSALEYYAFVTAIFHTEALKVLKVYPAGPKGDKRTQLGILGTDYLFTCPERLVAAQTSANNPVYLYHFDHSLSFDAWGNFYWYCRGHPCHGAELPFVFHSASSGGFAMTIEEERLSKQIIDNWGNFAWTGNPNKGKRQQHAVTGLEWPLYNNVTDQSMLFSTPSSRVQSGMRKVQCDFFDKLGYNHGN